MCANRTNSTSTRVRASPYLTTPRYGLGGFSLANEKRDYSQINPKNFVPWVRTAPPTAAEISPIPVHGLPPNMIPTTEVSPTGTRSPSGNTSTTSTNVTQPTFNLVPGTEEETASPTTAGTVVVYKNDTSLIPQIAGGVSAGVFMLMLTGLMLKYGPGLYAAWSSARETWNMRDNYGEVSAGPETIIPMRDGIPKGGMAEDAQAVQNTIEAAEKLQRREAMYQIDPTQENKILVDQSSAELDFWCWCIGEDPEFARGEMRRMTNKMAPEFLVDLPGQQGGVATFPGGLTNNALAGVALAQKAAQVPQVPQVPKVSRLEQFATDLYDADDDIIFLESMSGEDDYQSIEDHPNS